MPNPTPLQLMDRLLDALKEAGIGWCQEKYILDADRNPTLCFFQAKYASIVGALDWAERKIFLRHEFDILVRALNEISDRGIWYLNDHGWDFARFREELAKGEGGND